MKRDTSGKLRINATGGSWNRHAKVLQHLSSFRFYTSGDAD